MKRCPECRSMFVVNPNRRGGPTPKFCSPRCRYASRRCRKMRCQSAIRREGLCFRHYREMVRLQPAWTMADEILDFLDLEGWATPHEIADRFGRHLDSVERTLRKLRDEGRVVSKHIELAYAANSGAYEARTEWRAV